jgi:hypothetical protein
MYNLGFQSALYLRGKSAWSLLILTMEQYQASVIGRANPVVQPLQRAVGSHWAAQAGCQSNDIGKFTFTNNSTVKIMV